MQIHMWYYNCFWVGRSLTVHLTTYAYTHVLTLCICIHPYTSVTVVNIHILNIKGRECLVKTKWMMIQPCNASRLTTEALIFSDRPVMLVKQSSRTCSMSVTISHISSSTELWGGEKYSTTAGDIYWYNVLSKWGSIQLQYNLCSWTIYSIRSAYVSVLVQGASNRLLHSVTCYVK